MVANRDSQPQRCFASTRIDRTTAAAVRVFRPLHPRFSPVRSPVSPTPSSLGSPGQLQAYESNAVRSYCPFKQFAIHGLGVDYLKHSKLEGTDPATSICPPPTLPVYTENEKCQFSSVLPPASTQDASTITDVCHSGQQDGVEIVSLLEENLSLYRLRADTVRGYDNDDWLHTPLVSSNVDLSFDVIDETFKYMLLCAERVGQITKTYSDIDAVTRLLEEKERDLELTARIGQSLLKKVKVLTERNDYLEEKIDHVTEEVSQLRHDLSLKDDLLHIYTNNGAESDAEQQDMLSPLLDSSECSFFIGSSGEHTDSLQKKLHHLESENLSLRNEASHLKNETVDYEEKEKQLVNDCVKELKETSTQLTTLTEELMRRSDEAARQQEEITQLLAQVVDLQRKVKMFATDNDEVNQHLAAAKDAQRELTSELRYIKEKMQQCTDMLHEAQEEAKNLRNKAGLQTTSPRWFHPLVNFPMDSLAAEIEGTMRRELEDSVNPDKSRERRMFDTVRNVNEASKRRLRSLSPLPIPGSNQMSAFGSNQSSSFPSPRSSYYGSETSATCSGATNRSLDMDMSIEGEERRPGQPGMPGSNDLEAALRRLAQRREALLSERRFMDEEWDRRLLELSGTTTASTSVLSRPSTPTGSESSSDSRSAMSLGVRSFIPDKLQIVKPLEGSTTLQQWQHLAQPNLGGILDMRPGVLTKGNSTCDARVSRGLADPEEDEPCKDVDHQQDEMAVDAVPELDKFNLIPAQSAAQDTASYPGKCADNARYTYTLTTCRIIHPTDDATSFSRSGCAEDTGPHFDLRLED